MTYPTIVLKLAKKRLNSIYEKNKKATEEKNLKIYENVPRLKKINSQIAELLKSSLETASKAELKSELIQIFNKRTQTLLKYGYSKNALDGIHTCPYCKDEGFIDGEVCSCYRKIIVEEAYKLSNLDQKIKYENFSKFDLNVFENNKEEMKYILDQAHQFCSCKNDEILNLIFIGNTGTGKSFLSSCIAKEFLDNGYTVLYLSATKILNVIDDCKFKKGDSESLSQYFNFISDCDLLIIDDLGTEYTFEYPQAQLFDILEERIIKRKRTLISTNLDLSSITKRYSSRFLSRILGFYKILIFTSSDLRGKKMKK